MAIENLTKILTLDANQRCNYTLKEIAANKQVWILTDEHGCVMLNTEDDDCIPVWSAEELALLWATGEWAECKAEMISWNKWLSRWTQGLIDDGLSIVVFPNEHEEGIVLFPDEFEYELQMMLKKGKN